MSYATNLRAVRTHFDLSQHELAIWLGLSRVHLALIETDVDALPAHARPWLGPWLAALLVPAASDLSAEPAAPLPTLPPGPPALLARLHECRYQARRLHERLVAEQARTRFRRRRLAAGPLLLAALPPVATSPDPAEDPRMVRRRRWLARLLEEATDHLDPAHPTVGPTTEALLAARLSAWHHEAAWLTAYLTAP